MLRRVSNLRPSYLFGDRKYQMLSGAISPLYLEIKFEITVEKAYMSSPPPSTYTVVLIVDDVYMVYSFTYFLRSSK